MNRLNPSLIDLMKLAVLFLCMAFWSAGSIYAASDYAASGVKVSEDVGSNNAGPATLKKSDVRAGSSQISTHGPAFPDLIIQSLSIAPLRPTTRDEIRLSAVVKNTGSATSRMCQLEIKVGGEARGHRFKVPVLAPNRTHTARRTVTLPVAQRYRSTARIDVDNRNAESNESNNEKTFDFTVNPQPRPDLVIQRITISPENPTTRDEIRLSVAVKNSGSTASRMCRLEIKVGGEARGHQFKVPVLAPNRTHTARRTVTLPVAQRYRSTARIDVDNSNAESNESNNEKTFDFTVNPQPRPDLVIQRITISPENPTTTDEITLNVVVKNIGNGGSRSCQLEIKAGGEGRSPSYLIPVLAPNRTHTVRRTLTLPVARTYRSTATIDVDGRNTESDERNNQDILDFTVRSGV